jgi:hypothetical protein
MQCVRFQQSLGKMEAAAFTNASLNYKHKLDYTDPTVTPYMSPD